MVEKLTSGKKNRFIGAIMIDIDRFKSINDELAIQLVMMRLEASASSYQPLVPQIQFLSVSVVMSLLSFI